jgi:hypothetical protein
MNPYKGTSVLSLIFIVIGLCLKVNFLRQRSRHQASDSWVPVEGKANQSCVKEDYSTDSAGGSVTTGYRGVEGVNAFFGKEYHGDQIAFGPGIGVGRSRAEKVIARYSKSESLTVYYGPNKPEDRALDRRSSKTSFIYGIIGLVVSGVILVIHL